MAAESRSNSTVQLISFQIKKRLNFTFELLSAHYALGPTSIRLCPDRPCFIPDPVPVQVDLAGFLLCRFLQAKNSALTRSSRRLARAAWVKCIALKTRV